MQRWCWERVIRVRGGIADDGQLVVEIIDEHEGHHVLGHGAARKPAIDRAFDRALIIAGAWLRERLIKSAKARGWA